MAERTCPECDSPDVSLKGLEWECDDCGWTRMEV